MRNKIRLSFVVLIFTVLLISCGNKIGTIIVNNQSSVDVIVTVRTDVHVHRERYMAYYTYEGELKPKYIAAGGSTSITVGSDYEIGRKCMVHWRIAGEPDAKPDDWEVLVLRDEIKEITITDESVNRLRK